MPPRRIPTSPSGKLLVDTQAYTLKIVRYDAEPERRVEHLEGYKPQQPAARPTKPLLREHLRAKNLRCKLQSFRILERHRALLGIQAMGLNGLAQSRLCWLAEIYCTVCPGPGAKISNLWRQRA